MKLSYIPTVLFFAIFLIACGGGGGTPQTAEPEKLTAADKERALPKHPEHTHIYQAEKGITLTNTKGWKDNTYEFHLGYCEDMMASIADSVDVLVFCDCFLSKIQYYYPATFFKEAYEDQTEWNQVCFQKGREAKVDFYKKQGKK